MVMKLTGLPTSLSMLSSHLVNRVCPGTALIDMLCSVMVYLCIGRIMSVSCNS